MQVAGPKFHILYALTRLFESYVFKIVLPACFLWIRIRVSIKTTSLHEKCKLQKCPSHDGNAIIQRSTHNLQKQHSCMHVLMISSPIQSPISLCMFPFADLLLYAEHELKGGGVPSPEGLQLIWGREPTCS